MPCMLMQKDYGPPTDPREQPETADSHKACPLAEIWVTIIDDPAVTGRRRRLEALKERAQSRLALGLWHLAQYTVHVPLVWIVPQPVDGRRLGANAHELECERCLHVRHPLGVT